VTTPQQPPTRTEAQGDAESIVREKAQRFLTLAANPAWIRVGHNKVQDDTERADREAQIGLAYAMLDLADAIRNPGMAVQPGPCMATQPSLFDKQFVDFCTLLAGHGGAHSGANGGRWSEPSEPGSAVSQ
jgi:hypothetical protein